MRTMLIEPTYIRQVQQWRKRVGREIHKMHAFVRFRLVGTDPDSGREQFVAWFEPEHRIVRLAAPFFAKRFCGMDWSILTPFECAHWDGESLFFFSPGVERDAAPDEDALDELWLSYYRCIMHDTITYQWGRSWWGRLVSETGVRLYLILLFKYRHYRTRKWALAANKV